MKMLQPMNCVSLGVAKIVLFLSIAAAQADDKSGIKKKGDWLVGAKLMGLIPQESSVVSIGGEAKVDADFVPMVDVRYFLRDRLSIETIWGFSEHKAKAVGTALGDIDLGKTKVLPPTLTLQYHLETKSRFSPYIGAGVNYTAFVDCDPGAVRDVTYDDGFGYVINLGFDYFFGPKKYFNLDVKKYSISTDVFVDAGVAGTAEASVDLDPLGVSLGFGWVF